MYGVCKTMHHWADDPLHHPKMTVSQTDRQTDRHIFRSSPKWKQWVSSLTFSGGADATQDVHEGRLPCSTVAQQGSDLALVNVKGEACQQHTHTHTHTEIHFLHLKYAESVSTPTQSLKFKLSSMHMHQGPNSLPTSLKVKRSPELLHHSSPLRLQIPMLS